ncbi:hypothetical protein G6F62_012853 [Rhizopus arrhizus]|nr:hypothetical protein G6F62_012853 [Rhizopus arrhizus]
MCLPIWRRHLCKLSKAPTRALPPYPLAAPVVLSRAASGRRGRPDVVARMAAGADADRALRAVGNGADRRGDLPDVPALANHGVDAVRAGCHRRLADAGPRSAVGARAGAGLVVDGLYDQCGVVRAVKHVAGHGGAHRVDGCGRGGDRAGRQGWSGRCLRDVGGAGQAGAPGRAGRGAGGAALDGPDADFAVAALRASTAGGAMAGLCLHGVGLATRRAASHRTGPHASIWRFATS